MAEGGGLLRSPDHRTGLIHDFRPVFHWFLGWRWLATDRFQTSFGHTLGHLADANVRLISTRCAALNSVTSTSAKLRWLQRRVKALP